LTSPFESIRAIRKAYPPQVKGGSSRGILVGKRYLVVTADDYGIGPATSQGILDLARRGLVTNAVLMVNSPYAAQAVKAWEQAGKPMELGWHPALTIDPPLVPANEVSSLVGPDGCLWPLSGFMFRWLLGKLRAEEIRAELEAQYRRFVELVSHPPAVVNSHQHTQLFAPVGEILLDILGKQQPLPYVRRIRESPALLVRIRGSRLKRAFLSFQGRRDVRLQRALGFPGNDTLAGITDPPYVADPNFLVRWLSLVRGEIVELACHPGYHDETLIGRDCTASDGRLERRIRELHLLFHPSYLAACQQAGFTLIAPSQLLTECARETRHAA